MNASKHGIAAAAIVLVFLGTSSVAISGNTTGQDKLRTALAKEQLYGAHTATNYGYKWGKNTQRTSKESWTALSNENISKNAYGWDKNFRVSTATPFNYMATSNAELNTSANHTGYKWGIRSNSDQAGYKWG
ncbi:hypothetical protein, partial [Chromatocurvus halotolerans]